MWLRLCRAVIFCSIQTSGPAADSSTARDAHSKHRRARISDIVERAMTATAAETNRGRGRLGASRLFGPEPRPTNHFSLLTSPGLPTFRQIRGYDPTGQGSGNCIHESRFHHQRRHRCAPGKTFDTLSKILVGCGLAR
jgi:hypothetical protein